MSESLLLIILKILALLIIWLMTIVFGLLPVKVPSFKQNTLLLSLSNCFAGGLFLAIGLTHMLPEARELLEGKDEHHHDHDHDHLSHPNLKCGDDVFPTSYVLCLFSFAMILLIDKVVFNGADYVEDDDSHMNLTRSVISNKHKSVHENF